MYMGVILGVLHSNLVIEVLPMYMGVILITKVGADLAKGAPHVYGGDP